VHVALGLLRRQRVEGLLHAQHVERRHAEDLRFAPLEQRRTMYPRQHLDLGGQRADVTWPATVDAYLVAQHTGAHLVLGQRPQRRADLLLAPVELRCDALVRRILDAVERLLALRLAGDAQRLGDLVAHGARDGVVHVLLVVQEDRELGDRPGRDGR
jgi:hypothetical protein